MYVHQLIIHIRYFFLSARMGGSQVFRAPFPSPLHPWLGTPSGGENKGGSTSSPPSPWHSPFSSKPPGGGGGGGYPASCSPHHNYPTTHYPPLFTSFSKDDPSMGGGGGLQSGGGGDYGGMVGGGGGGLSAMDTSSSPGIGGGGLDLKHPPMLSPLAVCSSNKSGREGLNINSNNSNNMFTSNEGSHHNNSSHHHHHMMGGGGMYGGNTGGNVMDCSMPLLPSAPYTHYPPTGGEFGSHYYGGGGNCFSSRGLLGGEKHKNKARSSAGKNSITKSSVGIALTLELTAPSSITNTFYHLTR